MSSCLQPAEEHGLIDGIDSLDAYIERNYGDTVRWNHWNVWTLLMKKIQFKIVKVFKLFEIFLDLYQ